MPVPVMQPVQPDNEFSFKPPVMDHVSYSPVMAGAPDINGIVGLSNQSIYAAQAPLTNSINAIVAPQLATLKSDLGEREAGLKANAQSDFMKRGLTGSSSELGTLIKDIPGQTNKALATGEAALVSAAAPIAAQQQQMISNAFSKAADTGISLRSMVSEEQFKSMSLEQKDRLSQMDSQLQLQLKSIDVKYQSMLEQAKMAFEHAENERDRQIAESQFNYLKDLKSQEQHRSMVKGLTSLAGMGLGFVAGGTAGAQIGAAAGSTLGDSFNF